MRIGKNLSAEEGLPVKFGVPQGTVLGPILYLIFANELCSLDIGGKIIVFADDTAVIFQGNNWNETFITAELGMEKITLWLHSNILTLNSSKTKFLAFSLTDSKKPVRNTIKLHHCKINRIDCNCPSVERTDNIKYLGVIIDDLLWWDKHIIQQTTKLRKLVYSFIQLRQILTLDTLKIVYHALVESIARYGILAWGATYFCHINPVFKVQKLILRIMGQKHPLYPSDSLYEELQLLSIRQIYIHKLLTFIRKNPQFFLNMDHTHSTRRRNIDLAVPRMTTTAAQRTVTYLGPKIYNRLPMDIKEMVLVNIFKAKTKTWIIENRINYSEDLITN